MVKIIPDFEDYLIDDLGNVYSIKTNKYLKPNIINNGYEQVTLCKNGKRKSVLVHRLVASAFIVNTNNYPIVNHKDECKTNNNVNNLEWCSHKYNTNYSKYRFLEHYKKLALLHKQQLSKPILQLNKDGLVINEFISSTEASKSTGISRGNINRVCTGHRKSAGNYIWKFKEE